MCDEANIPPEQYHEFYSRLYHELQMLFKKQCPLEKIMIDEKR
jgi:hypothetical protein